MTMTKFVIALAALSLLPACALVSAPKAAIEVGDIAFEVKNLDKDAWTDCVFILNAQAGTDNQYTFDAGDVPGLSSKMVLLPRFAKADGKRFIPLVTKASDAKIQCKRPVLPYSQAL